MRVQIQKWGNSLALRIPKSFAVETNIENGTTVEVTLEQGQIVLKPAKEESNLESLLAKITKDNIHEEVDFGAPEGREVW